jgi:hypothetical protein
MPSVALVSAPLTCTREWEISSLRSWTGGLARLLRHKQGARALRNRWRALASAHWGALSPAFLNSEPPPRQLILRGSIPLPSRFSAVDLAATAVSTINPMLNTAPTAASRPKAYHPAM